MEDLKLLQHSKHTFTEFPVVLLALGYADLASGCQTAHPPCPFPCSVGSSPPTNLPIIGQAALMRWTGNHSSTCWAFLGKKTQVWRMCRCTPSFNQGDILKMLKISSLLFHVNKVRDKQVQSWCQFFKSIAKDLSGQARHHMLIPPVCSLTHKTLKGVYEMCSSWSAAGFFSRLLISDFH